MSYTYYLSLCGFHHRSCMSREAHVQFWEGLWGDSRGYSTCSQKTSVMGLVRRKTSLWPKCLFGCKSCRSQNNPRLAHSLLRHKQIPVLRNLIARRPRCTEFGRHTSVSVLTIQSIQLTKITFLPSLRCLRPSLAATYPNPMARCSTWIAGCKPDSSRVAREKHNHPE
jgi:hypothetical protein